MPMRHPTISPFKEIYPCTPGSEVDASIEVVSTSKSPRVGSESHLCVFDLGPGLEPTAGLLICSKKGATVISQQTRRADRDLRPPPAWAIDSSCSVAQRVDLRQRRCCRSSVSVQASRRRSSWACSMVSSAFSVRRCADPH